MTPTNINQLRNIIETYTDFNIITDKYEEPVIDNKKKNIYIYSKHFLQTKNGDKMRKINWLDKINFDMRFIDEPHLGCTKLAIDTYYIYGKNCFTVYITATYNKTVSVFNINKEHQILWTLDDINLCKNLNSHNKSVLCDRHQGLDKIIKYYDDNMIIEEYKKYPMLHLINTRLTKYIKDDIKLLDEDEGISIKSLLALRQFDGKYIEEFHLESLGRKDELTNYLKSIFGNRKGRSSIDTSILGRIKDISIRNGNRIYTKENCLSILCFLPCENKEDINILSNTLKKYIEDNNILPNYSIVITNSKITNKPVELINIERQQAIRNGKSGILILTGKQLSVGVSLEHCDIVLLLNGITSFDMIFQMMFRCLTESPNKNSGFVVDLNIKRTCTILVDYCLYINPSKPIQDTLYNIIKHQQIIINQDEWNNDVFHINKLNIYDIVEKIYKIWRKDNSVDKLIQKLDDIATKYEDEDIKQINRIFCVGREKKIKKENIDELEGKDKDIGDGIVEIKRRNSSMEKVKKIKVDFVKDILKYIIPVICILNINDNINNFRDLIENIRDNKYNIFSGYLSDLLINKNDIKSNIDIIINMYDKYFQDNDLINQTIIRIKHIFKEAKNDRKQLSLLVEKYLIPTAKQKTDDAHIPTPHKLINEMLDTIPKGFWSQPQKVLEPCAGTGVFLLNIIDRFMTGLVRYFPDEEERYKFVVEECIYWCELNSLNNFICRMLLDPDNKYKLNYMEGNTLEMRPTDMIMNRYTFEGDDDDDKFDLVVGNPPYQNRNKNKGTGNTLWDKFVYNSITDWLIKDGYLLFVHPRGWRQLNNKTGILMRKKQILYLNMNDVKEGKKMFDRSTDYDFYLLENKDVYKETIINDYNDNEYTLSLKNKSFIPNHSMKEVYSLIDYVDDDNGFLCSKSIYETRKKWMSNTKNEEHIYPCIYSIDSNNNPSLKWSSRNDKGHFGISKFIFSNGNGYIKDINGKYGLTEWAYAIICKEKDMDDIEQVFKSKKFRDIVDAIRLTSNKYNYVVLKIFKKYFWKEFINN